MDNGNDIQPGYSREDWENHYETNDLGWDLGEVAPPFVRLWEERKLSPCKVIIPGCGRGHEAIFLAEHGFQITAVDYTCGAVRLLDDALKTKHLSVIIGPIKLIWLPEEVAIREQRKNSKIECTHFFSPSICI